MVQVVLVRPGSTDFDQQGRIQGQLDLPMCESGRQEVARAAGELRELKITAVYASPCSAAQETAEAVAIPLDLKVKTLDSLHNLDHGLWQGMLVDDVKPNSRRSTASGRINPKRSARRKARRYDDAEERLQQAVAKLARKYRRRARRAGAPRAAGQRAAARAASRRLGRPLEEPQRQHALGNYRVRARGD